MDRAEIINANNGFVSIRENLWLDKTYSRNSF